VITIVIFLAGLFLGMLIELNNSNKISNLYLESEIFLADITASTKLIEDETVRCQAIMEQNIKVADEIYKQAKLLELYEDSGKITDTMKLLHKKYDLLRTLLWKANENALERCKDYNLVVYLYEYESKDIDTKAIQNVWSKILSDIKDQRYNIILLPIAANQDLGSTNFMKEKYEIKQLPAIVVNSDHVLYELENKESINQFLSEPISVITLS